MSKVFDSPNQEMFETFLIKEREQRDIEKLHGQEAIKYMGKCFKKEEQKSNIFTKIKWFIIDLIDVQKLKHIKQYHQKRIVNLSKEDLCDKNLKHKIYEKKDFKLHFNLNQTFEERTTIADCGGISYPYLCYKVSMQIEYSEILTQVQYEKEFEQIEKAENYFNELIKEYRNKSIEKIIDKLTNEINEHCSELKKRILFFKKN